MTMYRIICYFTHQPGSEPVNCKMDSTSWARVLDKADGL